MAEWPMPGHVLGDEAGVVKKTRHPATSSPRSDARARAAAIAVVVASMVITLAIVIGIHLLRANGLLAPGAR
ncbi:hypothetical protein SAMN04488581_1314 [Mycolicibacterium neoaurum]|uniref:hypothetical protein n=1 Tax=Mycolicibacterium neoaurum TaxID=1795 RepID=UPI00056BC381|nr:hypothetical protein [Mycolicibacterium neoaurum]SDC86787.1 hypothetical protein SAMN04488581_1314 [Mycolicibacterium neoaurum]